MEATGGHEEREKEGLVSRGRIERELTRFGNNNNNNNLKSRHLLSICLENFPLSIYFLFDACHL